MSSAYASTNVYLDISIFGLKLRDLGFEEIIIFLLFDGIFFEFPDFLFFLGGLFLKELFQLLAFGLITKDKWPITFRTPLPEIKVYPLVPGSRF